MVLLPSIGVTISITHTAGLDKFSPLWYAEIGLGAAPITKNGVRSTCKNPDRGMTPIEKNIRVVDEQGNEYEATWPKRARGLVKGGRARFISEDTICLACPPDINLEDTKMNDKVELGWLLQQIAAI